MTHPRWHNYPIVGPAHSCRTNSLSWGKHWLSPLIPPCPQSNTSQKRHPCNEATTLKSHLLQRTFLGIRVEMSLMELLCQTWTLDFHPDCLQPSLMVFFAYLIVMLLLWDKFSCGLRWKHCFPVLAWLKISTLSPACSVGPQATCQARRAVTQPQKQCGEVEGALDSGTWLYLGSHHQMLEEPKQATPSFGASIFLFASEVFGFLVPESLSALTFQTALPWLTLHRGFLVQGRHQELPWLGIHLGAQSTCRQCSGAGCFLRAINSCLPGRGLGGLWNMLG